MDYVYPAVFYKEGPKTAVVFPDLENLAACADTMEDAMQTARDACEMYLFIALKDSEQLPFPTAIGEIHVAEVLKELGTPASLESACVKLVTVNLEKAGQKLNQKMVQKNCSIPMWLNTLCLERDISFSEVLQNALLAEIQQKSG